ncbi:MAG: cyclase family protein [Planctomycetota bacterium]|nr:cyclase family protein [Planctomycetota bacterium]
MPIFDVSVPMTPGMPLYPGDPPFGFEWVRTIAGGASSNNSKLTLGSHTGTHIDAPLHFIPGGGTVESIPPEALVGPCILVDVGDADVITRGVIERLGLAGRRRILFRTKNSAWIAKRFEAEFVAFSADGAQYLAVLGPMLIGIDAPSLDPRSTPGHPAHLAILGSRTIKGAIEWLNLAGLETGEYELFCGPLRVVAGEAAPCRVLLRRP